MSWTIVNGEERHAQHPDTFEIPAERDRKSLRVGDFAKICLEGGEAGERFWLRVTAKTDDGRYVGKVDNDLVVYTEIPLGFEMVFAPEHVLSILPGAA